MTDNQPSRARGRGLIIVSLLAINAIILAASAMTWVSATVSTPAGPAQVSTTGLAAAAGTWTGALVMTAAALALALVNGWMIRVIAVVIALAGAGVSATAVHAWLNPETLVATEARVASGVTGVQATASASGVIVVVAVAGVAAMIVALDAARSAGHWNSAGRRFTPANAATGRGAEEHTGSHHTRPADPEHLSASQRAAAVRVQAMDDWDAIGSGHDPTSPSEPGNLGDNDGDERSRTHG